VKGVCVVDELQDADGSALKVLEAAVTASAYTTIKMALSDRVGGGRKEQFAFFWNPKVVDIVGKVQTVYFDEIERDPGVATFKAKEGFDFTLCAFHTRPSGKELRDELAYLDNVYEHVQSMSDTENDIIFAGDFNAPPEELKQFSQGTSMSENMGELSEYYMPEEKAHIQCALRRERVKRNIFIGLLGRKGWFSLAELERGDAVA
jgi:hypothetical protein